MSRSRYDEVRERLQLAEERASRRGLGYAVLEIGGAELAAPGGVGAFEHRCEARLRCGDVFGWIGPDRFAIGLPFADEAEAMRVWRGLWPDGVPGPDPDLRVAKRRVAADGNRTLAVAPAPGAPRPVVEVDPRGVFALVAQPLPRWKRLGDVVVAGLGLVLLAPLLLAIAAAVKLSSRGPVLFVHERTGRGLGRFPLLKFRTMIPGAKKRQQDLGTINEMTGPLFKAQRDPRLTSIGHVLRSTSLDELPQLWNVLRGQMSLIGPARVVAAARGLRAVAPRAVPRRSGTRLLVAGVSPGGDGLRRVDALGHPLRATARVRAGGSAAAPARRAQRPPPRRGTVELRPTRRVPWSGGVVTAEA